jgi:hypothetical protein
MEAGGARAPPRFFNGETPCCNPIVSAGQTQGDSSLPFSPASFPAMAASTTRAFSSPPRAGGFLLAFLTADDAVHRVLLRLPCGGAAFTSCRQRARVPRMREPACERPSSNPRKEP